MKYLLILLFPLITNAGVYFDWFDTGNTTFTPELEDYPIKYCFNKHFDKHTKALFYIAVKEINLEYVRYIKDLHPLIIKLLPKNLFEYDKDLCKLPRGHYLKVIKKTFPDEKKTLLGYVTESQKTILFGVLRIGVHNQLLYINDDARVDISPWRSEPEDRPFPEPMLKNVIKHELLHVLGFPHIENSCYLSSTIGENWCYFQDSEIDENIWIIFVNLHAQNWWKR